MAALSKKDKQGLLLLVVVALGFGAMFALNMRLSAKPELDERGCAEPIDRKTVVIIDRSDDTPTQTVQEMVSRVKRYVADQAHENELISLFEISGVSQRELEPIFSACLPKRDGNDLYENRRKIRKTFEQRFEKPLDAALTRAPAKSEVSPISEAISDVSASSFLDARSNRLMIFSDLLQHSDNGSLYNCVASGDAVRDFRAHRAGAIERPSFKNTSVELHMIPREGIGRATVSCRDGFWAWFFGDNEGAEASLVTRMLPGGAKTP